jgi:hypothetical protein
LGAPPFRGSRGTLEVMELSHFLPGRQQYPYTPTYGVPLTHPETPVQHQPTCVVARTSSGYGGRLAQGAADGAVPKDRLNFLSARPAIKKNVAA